MSIPEPESPSVRSAEGVELHMPLAGPAPRMLAYTIDAVILWAGLAATLLLLVLTQPHVGRWLRSLLPAFHPEQFGQHPEAWLLPVMLAFVLIGTFGELLYFVFWETVSGGSSPGKWLVGLRVVLLDGLRPGLRESLLRNVMRAADVLPSSYVVGLTTMIITRQRQRLGDLVAGTLVVRLDKPQATRPVTVPQHLTPIALSREQLQRLGEPERRLIRSTLRRAETVKGARREALLRAVAQPLCERLSLDPALLEDPEALLQRLWLTMQQPR